MIRIWIPYLHGDAREQRAARPRSGRRRGRSAERRSCAAASGRPTPPRRREAAPGSRARDAGSRFDGALRAALPAHKRAGERAAATQSGSWGHRLRLCPSRIHGGGGRSCAVGLVSGWSFAGWRMGRRRGGGRRRGRAAAAAFDLDLVG
jgi:hypothetical protein